MDSQNNNRLNITTATTFTDDEDDFSDDDLSDEQLKNILEQAIQSNRILRLENEIFERYLLRNDPKSVHAMAQVMEAARQAQRKASQLAPITSVLSLSSDRRSRRGTSISESSNRTSMGPHRLQMIEMIQKGFRISAAHRIEMVRKEMEEMRKSSVEMEARAEKTRAHLRAQLEEVELRIRETAEARTELEENVVKRGVDPTTGKIPAEKFVRFMEDWLKAADNMMEKLRLKSTTLKIQINKAKQQLAEREELGKTLHPIDFEQLAIENQIYQQKIDEKNRHLLELKSITGRCSLNLTKHKHKLNEEMAELKSIEEEVSRKQELLDKYSIEQRTTAAELKRTAAQLYRIMKLMDEYTAPDIIDFVKLRAEVEEMQKTYKRLSRHYEIQRASIKTSKKRVKRATTSANLHQEVDESAEEKLVAA